ncbi:MAG: hypothetical protein Q9225_000039 [Loekoesia sp. 1 TL-2023]
MATSILKISCACGQINGILDVPTSSLPLSIDFCHCSTCRHVTGQLCLSSFSTPAPPEGSSALNVTDQTVAYKTSDHLTRYFCGRCGASIYNHDSTTRNDHVASGVVDKTEGILTFKQHTFIGDTKDGGLSSWLEGLSWAGQPDQGEEMRFKTNPTPDKGAREAANPSEMLNCHCHCGGVQFRITRPNPSSCNLSAPVPDVLVPHHSQFPQNLPSSAWWFRANGTRYLAGTCACNSCRLSSGYDIQAWAFVPKANIRQMNGHELDYEMGTLKRYSHSKKAYREFCRTCGATVFWHNDERPGLVDVSVGLLDAEDGARAEGWLEWATERVSFEECAQNKSLVSSLSRGLRSWGERKAF